MEGKRIFGPTWRNKENIPKRTVSIILVITLITQEVDSFRLPRSQAASSGARPTSSTGISVSGSSDSITASTSHTESPAMTKSPSSSILTRISPASSRIGSTADFSSSDSSQSSSISAKISAVSSRMSSAAADMTTPDASKYMVKVSTPLTTALFTDSDLSSTLYKTRSVSLAASSKTLSTPVSKSDSEESEVITEMADRSSSSDLISRGVSEPGDEPASCISHDGRWGNTCGVKKRDVRDGDLTARLQGIQNYVNDTIETSLFRQYIKDGFIRGELRHAQVAVFPKNVSGNNYREKLTSLMKTLYSFVANVDYLRLCGLSAVAEPTVSQQLKTLTTMVFESLCTCETSAGSKGIQYVAPPAASLVSETLRGMVNSGASEMQQVQTMYLVVRDLEAVIREGTRWLMEN